MPHNAFVDSGDIIIGKCMGPRDCSVVLKGSERGFVDRNCYNDRYFNNVNGDGYVFAKVRIRGDRQPTIGDKFCLPEGHEVLTARGWVAIQDISHGDFVAQLAADGHVEYVLPTGVYAFQNAEPMIDLVDERSGALLLTVTPEHRLYVARRCASALELRDFELVPAVDLVGDDAAFASKTTCLGLGSAFEIDDRESHTGGGSTPTSPGWGPRSPPDPLCERLHCL